MRRSGKQKQIHDSNNFIPFELYSRFPFPFACKATGGKVKLAEHNAFQQECEVVVLRVHFLPNLSNPFIIKCRKKTGFSSCSEYSKFNLWYRSDKFVKTTKGSLKDLRGSWTRATRGTDVAAPTPVPANYDAEALSKIMGTLKKLSYLLREEQFPIQWRGAKVSLCSRIG